MNYRPYPDVDRALAQLERGRVPETLTITLRIDTSSWEAALSRFREGPAPRSPIVGWIDEHLAPDVQLTDWQRRLVNVVAEPAPQDGGREPVVTVHGIPLPGSNGISACCGHPPCEFIGERVTRDPDKVTCTGPIGAGQDEPDHVCNTVQARGEMDEPLGYLICGLCGKPKSGAQQ
ncbi:hypothetical protein [Streptomyces sp. NPDC044948]|uniref:hypothetical protein n=1 Tax=Streptomyces sp. NPDC044948 TaxID=3157092 RepID=UPI0033D549ED